VDSDGDGVQDPVDTCPDSALELTVVIGNCDSGVPNEVQEDGCTLADRIHRIDEPSQSPGALVVRVLRLSADLVHQGLIDRMDAIQLVGCAARSAQGPGSG